MVNVDRLSIAFLVIMITYLIKCYADLIFPYHQEYLSYD